MGGHGDPVKLGQTVKSAVALTKTPLPQGGGSQESKDLGFDVAAVETIIGYQGKVSGGVLHFSVPRAEKLTEEGMGTPLHGSWHCDQFSADRKWPRRYCWHSGKVKVLHRKKDRKMELIEAP